jgi:hypothetical protein
MLSICSRTDGSSLSGLESSLASFRIRRTCAAVSKADVVTVIGLSFGISRAGGRRPPADRSYERPVAG